MSFVFENLSDDKKIAHPLGGKPFQMRNLVAIMQHYCYNRWLTTRYSLPEYNYVVQFIVKKDTEFKAFPVAMESNTIPDIRFSNLKSSVNVKLKANIEPQYMVVLSYRLLSGKFESFDKQLISLCLMLIDGDWYVALNNVPGYELEWFDSIQLLAQEYGPTMNKYNAPKLKISGMNSDLTVTQALRLLQKLSRDDNNADSWAGLLDTGEDQWLRILGIPSKSSEAKFIPSLREFDNGLAPLEIEFKNLSIPYYYTGAITDNEFMIILVNNRWFLLHKEQARFLVSNTKDEARAQKLQSTFETPDQTKINEHIDKFKQYVIDILNNEQVELDAKVRQVETNWFVADCYQVNDKFVRLDKPAVDISMQDSSLYPTVSVELPYVNVLVYDLVHPKLQRQSTFIQVNNSIYELTESSKLQFDLLEGTVLWTNN